jgi:hypothetical protein
LTLPSANKKIVRMRTISATVCLVAFASALVSLPAHATDDPTELPKLVCGAKPESLPRIRELLQNPSVDVNARTDAARSAGSTALMCASYWPAEHRLSLLQEILKRPELDPNLTDNSSAKETALGRYLRESDDPAIFQVLLQHPKTDPNAICRISIYWTDTPLTIAASAGRIDWVKLLFQHPKIDVNIAVSRAYEGSFTALTLAARKATEETDQVVRMLLDRQELTSTTIEEAYRDSLWSNATLASFTLLATDPRLSVDRLSEGLVNATPEKLKFLLTLPRINLNQLQLYSANDFRTALSIALSRGRYDKAQMLLLDPRTDIRIRDLDTQYGTSTRTYTPLERICDGDHDNSPDRHETLKIFLANQNTNSVLNQLSPLHTTPLLLAIESWPEGALELLDDPRIDVNQVGAAPWGWSSQKDYSPLFVAVRLLLPEVVQRLVQFPGLDINYQNSQHWTAINALMDRDPQQKALSILNSLLARKDIDVNHRESLEGNGTSHCSPFEEAVKYDMSVYWDVFLADPRVEINGKGDSCPPAISLAAYNGDLGLVQRLFHDPRIDRSRMSHTLLEACERAPDEKLVAVLRYLLSVWHFDLNLRDWGGYTAPNRLISRVDAKDSPTLEFLIALVKRPEVDLCLKFYDDETLHTLALRQGLPDLAATIQAEIDRRGGCPARRE